MDYDSLPVIFKYSAIGAIITMIGFAVIWLSMSYTAYLASGIPVNLGGGDITLGQILTLGLVLRTFGYYFYLGVVISYIDANNIYANPLGGLLMFAAIPIAFTFFPSIMSADFGMPRGYWGIAALFSMLIMLENKTNSDKLRPLVFTIFSIACFFLLFNFYEGWLKTVDSLSQSIGNDPNYFYFFIPGALFVALNYYLLFVVTRKLIAAVISRQIT